MKVFISHSWKNKTDAQKIVDELQTAGSDLWLDINNLLPGQHIQKTIDEVLNKVDIIILVLTKEGSESRCIIDNNQYGIPGYADDAYFIQSLLANM